MATKEYVVMSAGEYQEHKSDGSDSNFFRLRNPEREDA